MNLTSNAKVVNQELYEEVADEIGVDEKLVQEVVNAHSKFTAKIVRVGAFEGVIMPYLGKIKVNPYKVQKIAANQEK